MDINTRIKAFINLGIALKNLDPEKLITLADKTANQNPWFTHDYIKFALEEVAKSLSDKKLTAWIHHYELRNMNAKKVAIIAAGNIPLVGFHDFLSVLLCGHTAVIKLSSKDTILLPFLADMLIQIEPAFQSHIIFTEDRISGFDAAIATGSDNTSRYFKYYFDKYPHIIRMNRSSCAILNGFETEHDLNALKSDVFTYFGLGCRNVSKLYVPMGYDITKVLDTWGDYNDVIHHHKYANNYNYQKSVLLLNKIPFLDNGYILLKESEQLVSPIAVLHYAYYHDDAMLLKDINDNQHKIQCITGNHKLSNTSFGNAQSPNLDDYADQIDTIEFLKNL